MLERLCVFSQKGIAFSVACWVRRPILIGFVAAHAKAGQCDWGMRNELRLPEAQLLKVMLKHGCQVGF